MRHGFSQLNFLKSACVIAALAIVQGNATLVQAQGRPVAPLGYPVPQGYAVPIGYPAPVVVAPVYAYYPVTMFGRPVVAYPAPVVYTPPVIVPQAYVTYSNPVVYGPSPAVVRDRVHVGLLGGVVHNYDVRGPGSNYWHLHSRDGWLGHYDRVRYHY